MKNKFVESPLDERQKAEAHLISQLASNRILLQRAMRDPRLVGVELTGTCYPNNYTSVLLDEDEHTLRLVIPFVDNPETANDDELDDELLDLVSGGAGVNVCKTHNIGVCCSQDPKPEVGCYNV